MKNYSMTSKKYKNHKRWLNAYVREWNKSLRNDDLWRGRFVIEQVSSRMELFEDKSGGILHCLLRFKDKKTNETILWYTDCLDMQWQMWHKLNDFICNVREKEKLYEEK